MYERRAEDLKAVAKTNRARAQRVAKGEIVAVDANVGAVVDAESSTPLVLTPACFTEDMFNKESTHTHTHTLTHTHIHTHTHTHSSFVVRNDFQCPNTLPHVWGSKFKSAG